MIEVDPEAVLELLDARDYYESHPSEGISLRSSGGASATRTDVLGCTATIAAAVILAEVRFGGS